MSNTDTIVINSATLSALRADEYAMMRNKLHDRLNALSIRGETLEAYLQVIEGRFRAGNTEAAVNTQSITVEAASEVMTMLGLLARDLAEVVDKSRWVGGKGEVKLGKLIKVVPR